jgi:hypothetical protein
MKHNSVTFHEGEILSDSGFGSFRAQLSSLCERMGMDRPMQLWSNLVAAKGIKTAEGGIEFQVPTPKPLCLGEHYSVGTVVLQISTCECTPVLSPLLFEGDCSRCSVQLYVTNLMAVPMPACGPAPSVWGRLFSWV